MIPIIMLHSQNQQCVYLRDRCFLSKHLH